MAQSDFLVIEQLSKRFGSTRALDGVSLSVAKGEIFGLAGENGAGKSTLIKILCGVHAPDGGRILFDGKPHRPRDPEEAERTGISVFHQEIPVCPNLSIAANVFLGPAMPSRGFAPDWRGMNRECAGLYRSLLGEEVDPTRLIRDCAAAERQLALLVRVLSRAARLVILDEPTTALTPPEVARLFGIIRRLREQGITFIFISHMLEELMALSDQIGVLRDGKNAGGLQRGDFELGRLSAMIAGRTIARQPRRGAAGGGGDFLTAAGLSLPGEFEEVSFRLGKGEILGVAGLQGSGRSALVRALFGAPPPARGDLRIEGEAVQIDGPVGAMAAGIGFVPEDRKTLGIFDDLDVKLNLCMAGIDRFSRGGLLHTRRLRSLAATMRDRLSIKMQSLDAPVTSLSGGNQQKVLISRWLALKPRILLLNEPTRGVDVGAKQEITELIRSLADEGITFVISSSELEELLVLSDRILVMHRGRVSREFAAGEVTKEQLILAATT